MIDVAFSKEAAIPPHIGKIAVITGGSSGMITLYMLKPRRSIIGILMLSIRVSAKPSILKHPREESITTS